MELLRYDDKFPATVKQGMQGKLEDIVDFIEAYDYLKVLKHPKAADLPLNFFSR